MKSIIRLSAILVLFGCQISGFSCLAGSITKNQHIYTLNLQMEM